MCASCLHSPWRGDGAEGGRTRRRTRYLENVVRNPLYPDLSPTRIPETFFLKEFNICSTYAQDTFSYVKKWANKGSSSSEPTFRQGAFQENIWTNTPCQNVGFELRLFSFELADHFISILLWIILSRFKFCLCTLDVQLCEINAWSSWRIRWPCARHPHSHSHAMVLAVSIARLGWDLRSAVLPTSG